MANHMTEVIMDTINKPIFDTTGYKLFYQQYNSLEDFLRAIIQMPINYQVFESPTSKNYMPDFHYLKSFEEAWNKCYYGDNENYENFKMKFDYLKKIYNDTQADFIQNGFVCEGNKTDRIQYKNSVDLLTEQNVAYHITKWLDGNDYTYGSQLVTKIMKRSIFEISYFKVADNFNNGEDFISFLYYMYYGKKAVTTDKVYYHYIVHDESLSQKKNGARQLLVEDKLTEQVVHILDELSMNISGKIIEKWIIRRKGYALMQQIPEFKFYLINYQFQNIEMLLYKNIVIYGAGKVGQDLFRQISLYKNINIVGWLDKNPQKYNFTFQKVYDIGHLKNIHYDFIIIAVKQKELAEQIRADLFQIGVPDNVIVWQKYRSLLD